MKLTRKLLALCSIAVAFCVLAVAQDQGTRLTTNDELKQWLSTNRTDFDKLRKFSSRFKDADSPAEKEVKKPGSIDTELGQVFKKLHIIELGSFGDGDVEIVVNKDGRSRAGYLFSPGRKNHGGKSAAYIVLESLGNDWFLFRRS